MIEKIEKCRICGNSDLADVVSLGDQYLTGVFPHRKDQKVTAGPLALVRCNEEHDRNACGLLQLKHSYDFGELYGDHYGYRSGLNKSMVQHLHGKVKKILAAVQLDKGDMVVDIGSNDSTLLQAYPKGIPVLVGVDPTGKKFKEYYPDHIILIADFFSAEKIKKEFPGKKAKVITSISMFYDLEDPLDFMQQIYEVLADDGVWVFEQSYMPTMLATNSYDTICHEHLEYYALKQIKWMADKVGFNIIDVEFNNVNGGSFSVTAAKRGSKHKEMAGTVTKILNDEQALGLSTRRPYLEFGERIVAHRNTLRKTVGDLREQGKKVFGYGASTKGNVILQHCGFTQKDLPFIADVNKEKFGAFTPGTLIPIISEEEAKSMKPDCFLVLIWHFREFILNKENDYLDKGGKFIFPLPEIQFVDKSNKNSPKSGGKSY